MKKDSRVDPAAVEWAAEFRNPTSICQPFGPYSQVGLIPLGDSGHRILFVSGITSRARDGSVVRGNLDVQVNRVFENLSLVMNELGGSVAGVTKLNIYVTDAKPYSVIAAAKRRWFVTPYPASTLVEVQSLNDPALLIEVEAYGLV